MIDADSRLDIAQWAGGDDEPPLPDWLTSLRPLQVHALDRILDAFGSGARTVMLQSTVGSGKTLLGELTRRALGARALYICSSIELQHQAARDFPYAKVLLGRSNFKPLKAQVSDAHAHLTCADCVKRNTPDGGKECAWCPDEYGGVGLCPYERAKAAVFRARLAIVNTSYALTEWNHVGHLSGKFDLVIADEGDLIPQAVTSFVEVSISARTMSELEIARPKHVTVAASWPEWFPHAMERVGEAAARLPETDEADASIEGLKIRRQLRYFNDLYAKLEEVAAHLGNGGWVYDDSSGGVTFRPIRPDAFGDAVLWSHAKKWLVMSGTLIADYELKSMAAPQPSVFISTPSPFPVHNRPVLFTPVTDMSEKNRYDAWPRMAVALRRLMVRYEGLRGIVHTVSGQLARYLHAALRTDYTILYASAADKDEALARYRETEGAVLFTPSLVRGFDGKDGLARWTAIVRVPYLSLGDRQVAARLRQKGAMQEGATWYAIQAVRGICQSIGRVVRHEADYGWSHILDEQFSRFLRPPLNGFLPAYLTEVLRRDVAMDLGLMANMDAEVARLHDDPVLEKILGPRREEVQP